MKPQRQKILKRRRPSQPWGLWKVALRGSLEAAGFLVTTQDDFPLPIAYIKDTSATGFQSALLIHENADLWTARKDWRLFIGLILIPIDAKGRQISRSYIKFGTYAPDYFKLGLDLALAKAGAETGQTVHPFRAEKKPNVKTSSAQKLASKSEKTVVATAA